MLRLFLGNNSTTQSFQQLDAAIINQGQPCMDDDKRQYSSNNQASSAEQVSNLLPLLLASAFIIGTGYIRAVLAIKSETVYMFIYHPLGELSNPRLWPIFVKQLLGSPR